jgi:hypothetical protein
MPRFARVGSCIVGFAIPLVVGCASTGVSPSRVRYQPEEFAQLRDSLERSAEERASEPRIRIITPSILGADRFVESSFRVSEDAYVAVVAVSYDGLAHVVYPESPSASGFVHANTLYRLPTFFAGFGARTLVSFAGSRFRARQPHGGTAGLIFAVASDRPVQLQRLATNSGEWDEHEIERLLWGRSYNTGAFALGRTLALTGQDFDIDFSGFTQGTGRPSYMFASLDAGGCDSDMNTLYSEYYSPVMRTGVMYLEIDGIQYLRMAFADACSGYTRYQLVPVGPVRPVPLTPDDSSSASDSGSASGAGRIARAPNVGRPVEPGDVPVVERPGARGGQIGRADSDRGDGTSTRPMIDRGLRFLPPERVRDDGRARSGGGGSLQDDLGRERNARRVSEEQQRRTASQREAAPERSPRAEPAPAQPAAIERTSTSSQSGGGESSERSGKPIRD